MIPYNPIVTTTILTKQPLRVGKVEKSHRGGMRTMLTTKRGLQHECTTSITNTGSEPLRQDCYDGKGLQPKQSRKQQNGGKTYTISYKA